MADETSEPLSDNAALNSMVDELLALNGFLAGKYDRIQGDANFVFVDDTHPYIRGARETAPNIAVKTTVTNKGPNQVEVRENGVLCMIVPANTTQQLPLAGAKPLQIKVATGQTANISVATYTKNA